VVEAINAAVAEARISADLVDRIGQGDRRAESAMVERYRRGLLFLLRKRTGDPALAEDMCQETLRIAIEKLRGEPINEAERLAAYLHGVAVNLVRNEWRKSARRVFSMIRNKKVKLRINQRYPLKDAVKLHRDVQSRKTTGISMLVP